MNVCISFLSGFSSLSLFLLLLLFQLFVFLLLIKLFCKKCFLLFKIVL